MSPCLEEQIGKENTIFSPKMQYTSADGFFNRKRGRPPKNRFVQVYKNLQPDRTPQAVFTSFKLEKQNNAATNFGQINKIVNRSDIEKIQITKDNNYENGLNKYEYITNDRELSRKTPDFRDFGNDVKEQQQQKLVRSAGTFFPASKQLNPDFQQMTQPSSIDPHEELTQDMPEDLSIRKQTIDRETTKILCSDNLTYSYLQMFHIWNLYRQTQQLPLSLPVHSENVSQQTPRDLQIQNPNSTTIISSPADLSLNSSKKSLPFGYSRYRFSEDCAIPRCGYRQRQTHFHCDRNDCQYGFCDRARFQQHTARHRRLDELLASDFKHFRPNVDCNYASCTRSAQSTRKTSSHFHCLKCPFVCYETNKFTSHRRLHSKLSYFKQAGFRKIISRESCSTDDVNDCIYSQKQTHYHCLTCDFSVLSKAQFVGHQHRSL